jgi:progesterone-induced-blocking factor 1
MASGLNKLVDSMKREIQALRADQSHSKKNTRIHENLSFRRNNSSTFSKSRPSAPQPSTKAPSFPSKNTFPAQNKDSQANPFQRQATTEFNDTLKMQTLRNKDELDNWNDQSLRVKEAIRLAREMLHGLAPKDMYYRIKDLPDGEVTLSEYVLIKTHELVYPLHQDNQQLLLENASLKEDLKFKNEKLKLMAVEIENADRLLNDKSNSQLKIIEGLEKERHVLLTQLDRGRDDAGLLRDRLAKEEEVSRENRLLKEETMILKHKLALLDPNPNYTRSSIEEERNSLYKKVESLQKDCTDLALDNTRKHAELQRTVERLANSEEESKRLQIKNDKYIEDLMQMQRNVSEGFEKRLNIELESIRLRNTKELEGSRASLQHLYETQISFLKEQKEDLERELLTIRARLIEKDASCAQLRQENNELTKTYETELAQTRAELTIKAQELSIKSYDLEIIKKTESSLRIENDALKEKVTVLRNEVYKTESKFNEEIGIVKADNLSLRRELQNYDLIEKEVDNCILQQSLGGENEDMRMLMSAPTSKNKRILQALTLGQKLSAKERENADLRRQLSDSEIRIRNLDQELESLKRVAEITKNPGNYLVRVIEEKEAEVLALRRTNSVLERDNSEVRAQLEGIKRKYTEISGKMGVLETKRDDIKQIQEILMGLAEGKKPAKDIERNLEMVKSVLDPYPEVPVREDLDSLDSTKKPNWYYQLKSKGKK